MTLDAGSDQTAMWVVNRQCVEGAGAGAGAGASDDGNGMIVGGIW